PDGFIYDKGGVTGEKIDYLLELRATGNDIVKPYADKFDTEFHANKRPWNIKVDIAMPCATENELDEEDAKALINNGCILIAETSNMGCTAEAIKIANKNIVYAPGKAVNAGGVATSGLEMSQNSMRYSWTVDEVDNKLHQIMKNIHDNCIQAAEEYGFKDNYAIGANIAGFKKVADAMIDQGVV
ncbi:glutamate dehydrogenase, partial [candidate division WOR-3 bacterium]|nr:glutamate dehydrogenase [candidate division WOR-3 bacterium]